MSQKYTLYIRTPQGILPFTVSASSFLGSRLVFERENPSLASCPSVKIVAHKGAAKLTLRRADD